MKAVSVLSTPTLLSSAGNRDFLHIFNNGSEPIFIAYDGQSAINATPVTINLLSTITNTHSVNELFLESVDGLEVGMTLTSSSGAIPGGIQITAIDSGGGITCTTFIALAGQIGGTITAGPALTIDTGRPVASGAWYDLNSDGTKSIFNKAVYAVAETGPVDVRLQGE